MAHHSGRATEENLQETTRLTATLNLRDPRGLHCRVSALLAHRLRVEAPSAEVTLRTLEGRQADPKKPLQTMNLGARHSGVVEVEATGDDAAKAMEIVRSVVEREPLSREEVIEAIPEGADGEIGEIRAHQQSQHNWESWADQREQDANDLWEWKQPGGWIYELAGPEQLGYGPDEPEDEEDGFLIPGL
jgi:phosphotransferase system HPr (HPr) family protein